MILLEHDSTHALNKYRGDPANRSENTQICENHCPPHPKTVFDRVSEEDLISCD